LDYQTLCQSCPIAGSKVCTISSLISCLSNYWLDNNAANCISCDPYCQQCSSTTRCSVCLPSYYLTFNFTCSFCPSMCSTCFSNSSCSSCSTPSSYFNSSTGLCSTGGLLGCLEYDGDGKCLTCNSSSYLLLGQCVSVPSSSLVNDCETHSLLNNGSIACTNCSADYFNSTVGCLYGCSVLCTSCYGPHFGLCFGCISAATLFNYHCLPTFNLNSGAVYQLYYCPFSNPSFFKGGTYRA